MRFHATYAGRLVFYTIGDFRETLKSTRCRQQGLLGLGRDLMASMVREFARHVVPQILKPLRALWNEVIGFVFLALAVLPVPRTYKIWREFEESGEGLVRLGFSLVFVLMMACFGIHSFLRARKISRS